MKITMSEEAKRMIDESVRIAEENKSPVLLTGHLLEAMLTVKETEVDQFFNEVKFDKEKALNHLHELMIDTTEKTQVTPIGALDSPMMQKLLDDAADEAAFAKRPDMTSLFILLALFLQPHNMATRILTEQYSRVEWIQFLIQGLKLEPEPWLMAHRDIMKFQEDEVIQTSKSGNQFNRKNFPVLYEASRNLTELARTGKLDPVIGREQEIDRALQILGRRTKNNPMLLGEPGVGKTAVAEGVALRIASGDVPTIFKDKEVIQLNISNVVAGTKFRGEFEEKMKRIIEEIHRNGHVILFIDEMHMLMRAGGSEGAVDASNILKPALARGELQMMGATTFDEYQKHIEKDRAFERRFSPVKIEEPSTEDTLTILKGLKDRYETYHQLHIEDEALQAAVTLADRYLTDRQFPDKAIDLIDEAASRLRLEKNETRQIRALRDENKELEQQKQAMLKEQHLASVFDIQLAQEKIDMKMSTLQQKKTKDQNVTVKDIETVLSEWTGIPLKQMEQKESERLLKLENTLHKRVIGQDEACSAVARAIRRARSGLRDLKRPIGSFMFLGPTGVGKTELAKTLAATMFGSEDNIIRVDMSEYMSQENVSRLIGSAPGYVGYDEGGQLTEKVRHNPYSVVLFDEVEKAHPEVFNLMLQMLDDGYVTDAKGRKVDFKNTIIIMTSNLGATELRDNKTVGFGSNSEWSDEQIKSTMLEALKQHFRPEFLNRIDETIIFHSLDQSSIYKITKLMIHSLNERLAEQGITLKVTTSAIEWLGKKGYDPENGARPLQRVIQNEVEDLLSEKLLSSELTSGDTAKIGMKQGKLYLDIIKA